MSSPNSSASLDGRGEERARVSDHSTASGNNLGFRIARDLGQLRCIHFTAGLSLPPPASLAAGLSACCSSTVSTTAIYRGKFTALLRWKQRNPSPLLHHTQTQTPWGCLALPTAPSSASAGLVAQPRCCGTASCLAQPSPACAWQRGQAPQAHLCAMLPDLRHLSLPQQCPPAAEHNRSVVLVTTEPTLPPFPFRGEQPRQQHPPCSPARPAALPHRGGPPAPTRH